MTENEARQVIECIGEKLNDNSLVFYTKVEQKALDMAIQAIEEIQKYRAIGTIEELVKTQIREKVLNAELESYKEIGTIEELQALKEKIVAKKPIDISRARDCEGYIGLVGKCPCCGEILEDDIVYCDCGQKLDWH